MTRLLCQSILCPQPLKNENWTYPSSVEHCLVDSHLYAERRTLKAAHNATQIPPRRSSAAEPRTPLNTSSGSLNFPSFQATFFPMEEDAGPCLSSRLSSHVYGENMQREHHRPNRRSGAQSRAANLRLCATQQSLELTFTSVTEGRLRSSCCQSPAATICSPLPSVPQFWAGPYSIYLLMTGLFHSSSCPQGSSCCHPSPVLILLGSESHFIDSRMFVPNCLLHPSARAYLGWLHVVAT